MQKELETAGQVGPPGDPPPGYFWGQNIQKAVVRDGLVEVIPRSKGVRGNVFLSLGLGGCHEEGNLVVAPAAALQLDHPCEQRTLTGGPVIACGCRRRGGVGRTAGLSTALRSR